MQPYPILDFVTRTLFEYETCHHHPLCPLDHPGYVAFDKSPISDDKGCLQPAWLYRSHWALMKLYGLH